MKDQVMTINSVQKSSKSELSSGTFGHFKVLQFCTGGWLAVRQTKKQNEHCQVLNEGSDSAQVMAAGTLGNLALHEKDTDLIREDDITASPNRFAKKTSKNVMY